MELLWVKGSTKYQKILSATLCLLTPGPLFLMFTHNFVNEPKVSTLSFYISLVLTVFFMLMLVYFYAMKLWKPEPAWYQHSKFRKASVILFMPVLVFFLFWINLSIAAPQLFTALFGDEMVIQDEVLKVKRYARNSCDYRLVPQSINTKFFHYCISPSFYNQLPATKMKAELIIKQSGLGYIVKDIKPLPKAPINGVIHD